MASQSDRPVFVIGCPRSGTTLLQLMVHSHRRIAMPCETRFVLPAYYRRNKFGDLHDVDNRRALAEWIVNRKETKFSDLHLDPKEMIEEIVEGPPALGSAVGLVFQAFARKFDKPRWGDKRPVYVRHVDALQRMWPDAQFIHLIRDGRDCVASLKEMSWYKGDLYDSLAVWREAVDFGDRHAERLGSDSYHEMRYEDLVSDPATSLAALCDFLGEEYDPEMTAPNNVASNVIPEKKKWHVRTREEVNSDRVRSWESRLEPWEISLAEWVLGSRLAAKGYELSGARNPSPQHLARFAKTVVQRKNKRRKRTSEDRRQRRQELGPVAAQELTEPARVG